MKSRILSILFCSAFFCFSHPDYGQGIEKTLQLSLTTGRQVEDFSWSIAGNISGQSPNVLSELKWQKVSGQNYAAALQWNPWKKVFITGGYNRVSVHSGNVSDIDYTSDNRTQPNYNQNFSDKKGYTSAWFAGAGYAVINSSLFSLVPFAGYGINAQSLYIVDLTGRFPGLDSRYDTEWKGPFLEIKSSVKIVRDLKLTADLAYNQVTYSARGDWNLISQFQHPVSYRHSANGYGVNASIGLAYSITPNIAIDAGYSYFNWETGNGTDQLYLSSGQVDKTQMNGVKRKGHLVGGGIIVSY
ncbi:hypothetical protein [Mucilaginibacter sp. L3T2-6]|uniref:hypothetical protein n=1 Tax=Mucilaginibacter sp. L3T2-6 TaxID=3062491 RepID=UPI00267577D4|nr:hypothetical protein [Mucilaginibacter sp. L3T2-6]MDO3641788.1 hypothetical protein [Mucilaginibacter sp. L3T2-6]MDV6214534.1 hypothetical protein [Mucilaginibacter sp. L3T2-6]